MKTIFNPGTKKKLTLVDNVVYSTVKDLNGDPLELKAFGSAPERKQ